MKITTTQKTMTLYSVAMDAADVKDMVATAVRRSLVADGTPGVTVDVEMTAAAGEISAVVSIAVASVSTDQQPADASAANPPAPPPVDATPAAAAETAATAPAWQKMLGNWAAPVAPVADAAPVVDTAATA